MRLIVVHNLLTGYPVEKPESDLRQMTFDLMVLHCLGKPVPLSPEILETICSQFSVIRSYLTTPSARNLNPLGTSALVTAQLLAMSFWYEVYLSMHEFFSLPLGPPAIPSKELQMQYIELPKPPNLLSLAPPPHNNTRPRYYQKLQITM